MHKVFELSYEFYCVNDQLPNRSKLFGSDNFELANLRLISNRMRLRPFDISTFLQWHIPYLDNLESYHSIQNFDWGD
jgi:hypothetical protein